MNGTTISTLSRNNFNQLLESQEDTKRMITVEETNPSTHVYQQGNYLIYNNQLYKVTAAINIGDTLSTLTNISLVNVGEELKATAGGDPGGEVITPPVMTSSTFTYDGTSKSPTFSGFDEETMISANNSETQGGSYKAAIALMNGNNTWSDTNDNQIKQYPWQINPAQATLSANTYSVTVSPDTPYVDVILSYNGDADWVCYSNNILVATCTKVSATTCRISGIFSNVPSNNTSVSIYAPATRNYTAVGPITVNVSVVQMWGAVWTGTEDPSWIRIGSAANLAEPIPYDYNAASDTVWSSPFDNIYPWAGMTKSDRTGGTMVSIPKFYYRLGYYEGTTGLRIDITDTPLEGFSVSPAHVDRNDGKGERNITYVGRYKCVGGNNTDTTVRYKSLSGYPPGYNTLPSIRTQIHSALGSKIWQFDFSTMFTIWLLYLVEYADWNSQTKIGPGGGTFSNNEPKNGYTDAMPYHTGKISFTVGSSTKIGSQYRYIEGLWEFLYQWVDGCLYGYNTSGSLYLILNPSYFTDYIANVGDYGFLIGQPPRGGGVPTSFTINNSTPFPTWYPKTYGSNIYSTYTCDRWSSPTSGYDYNYTLAMGGVYENYQSDDTKGLFLIYISQSGQSTSTSQKCGYRLIELP